MSPELLRSSRLKAHSIRRHDKRRPQAIKMSASGSVSVRVQEWNPVKTDLITAASKCLLKTGGPAMLNITGMNKFYYIRNFTDMRCKYSRILAVIRHLLGREPELEEQLKPAKAVKYRRRCSRSKDDDCNVLPALSR